MEMNILKERETPLLSRKRYTLEITKEGPTPSRKEIRDLVATKVKANKELTVIKHVYPRYGVQKARIIAHIYDTKEEMVVNETEGLLKKHAKAENKEEKAEAAPAVPDEAPAEEKKE